jgi:CheY-like chemotaxis protein
MKIKLTILIIEDEPDLRTSLAANVREAAASLNVDVSVLEAGSAYDATRLQLTHAVDAVFVDYHLQDGESGRVAVDAMRDPFGRLYVVLVSGASAQELSGDLAALHERLKLRLEFVPKPVPPLKVHYSVARFKDFVMSRPAPHPLAVALKVARQGSNPTLQLQGMERAFELILKISVFIMASDLATRGISALDSDTPGFAQMLTLGPWLALAEKLGAKYRLLGDAAFAPELPNDLKRNRGGVIGVIRSFKPVRDDEIHHGLPTDGMGHEARIKEYRPRFDQLVESLGFLRDLVWAASEDVDIAAGEDFAYLLRVFMGESDRFESVPLSSRERLERRRVYAFDGRLRRLSLYPFVLWTACETCNRGRLFLLDNFNGHFSYKDVFNHVIADPTANADLMKLNQGLITPAAETASEAVTIPATSQGL